MRYFYLLFFCLVHLTTSLTAMEGSSSHLSHTEVYCHPSTIVDGCVNVITGSYRDINCDLIIPSPEPLIIQRFYHSVDFNAGVFGSSWSINHIKHARIHHAGGQYVFTVAESMGSASQHLGGKLRRLKGGGRHYFIPLDSLSLPYTGDDRGLTNTASGEIIGATNLKNQIATYDSNTNSFYSRLCSGNLDTYSPMKPISYWEELPVDFLLTSETRTNGHHLLYDYITTAHRHQISLIKSTDGSQERLFGSIQFDYSKYNGAPSLRTLKLTASDGREATYKFRRFDKLNKWYLIEAAPPNSPLTSYTYLDLPHWPIARICRKNMPEERYKEIDYDAISGRVSILKGPVGYDETSILTHRFTYKARETEVCDAYNHRTIYRFNYGERLTSIERYLGTSNYIKYSTDLLFWGQENTAHQCDLVCKALQRADGTIHSCCYMTYDSEHNVVAESLYGNLSGTCLISPLLNSDGIPQHNDCESYTIRRTYSFDKFHLLTSETLPNGRTTLFRYKPNTPLISAKLVTDGTNILTREYSDYDNDGILIRKICDNGSAELPDDLTGVTYRTITYITPRAEIPCIGLPEVVEERYLDVAIGVEQLLSRQVNRYSVEGHITQQDHYDANNQFRYTLRWDYDSMGNILLEQNAIGQLIQRRYDANGNKIFEQGLNPDCYTEYTYDFSNRLIAEEQIFSDGLRFKQSYLYDYLGNKIAFVDIFGQTKTYTYDDFGRPTTLAEKYDICGNVVEIKDSLGAITRKRYNIRNQPTRITYSNSTQERFEYYRDGSLSRKIEANGASTLYTYDVIGNLVREELFSAAGELLRTIKTTFQGNLLVAQTDANSITTTYEYDGAGRQISILRPGASTHIEYDSLGRKYKLIEWIGPQEQHARVTVYEYDLLNRLVEKRVEDHDGNCLERILTEYDSAGHPSITTTFTELGPATTRTLYTPQGKPFKIIDVDGNETLIYYDYCHLNTKEQHVLQITTVDSMGNPTIVTHDTDGRIVCCIKQDAFGQETAKTLIDFDGLGRIAKRIDFVKTPNSPDCEFITEWQYDAMGHLVGFFEAVGTPQSRATHFSYNQQGQKETEILPDGVIVRYKYDPLGRLSSCCSSDNTVAYHYSYDANGNILSVFDAIHDTTTTRTYDSNNRLVEETMGNGLRTSYQYDGIGRTTTFRLPDQSAVRYRYNTNLLKGIFRLDDEENITYTHCYLVYDPAGLATSVQMIKNAGWQTISRDKHLRVRRIKSSHFEEEIPPNGYNAVGDLCEQRHRDVIGRAICRYTYNSLSQLIGEDGIATHRYIHDSLNNRVKKDGTLYKLDALNQLTQQGKTTYRYDARGNRIEQDTRQYSYDALGRLTEMREGKRRWVYGYDAFNRRLSKTKYKLKSNTWVASGEERYLYQQEVEVGTVDPSGKLLQFRLIGQNMNGQLQTTVAIETGQQLSAVLHNHAGHPVAIVDANNGEVTEAYRYNAFGEETGYTTSWMWGWTVDSALTNPWRYRDQRRDPESGLIHHNGSYYDPQTSRYLSPRGPDPS